MSVSGGRCYVETYVLEHKTNPPVEIGVLEDVGLHEILDREGFGNLSFKCGSVEAEAYKWLNQIKYFRLRVSTQDNAVKYVN